MFCEKCGNQIPDGSVACNFCGTPQKNQAVSPQSTGFGGGPQPVTPPVAPPFQPAQPFQPIVPPPAPKKKNNTLLIVIIAILAVVAVGAVLFLTNPGGIFNSSQQSVVEEDDEKKDEDKNKDDAEADSDIEDEEIAENEDEDVLASDEAAEAEEALDTFLSYLYDPDSDEFAMAMFSGSAPSTEEEKATHYLLSAVLEYYDYEITGCTVNEDSYTFTVDIETVDFYSITDQIYVILEDISLYPEDYEHYLDYSEEYYGMLIAADAIETGYPDTEILTIDIEMIYDENRGWVISDEGFLLGVTLVNNMADAMSTIA